MWMYEEKELLSIPEGMISFVYLITNLTNGKLYVGKKQFYSRVKKKITESDWKTYTGSSLALNADISKGDVIKKEILHLCKSKGLASYLELKEQIEREVLLKDEYYNAFIGCKIHAKHITSFREQVS